MIEEGPFRLSRNPLYVGLLLLYVGLALLAPTFWGLVLFPVAVLLVLGARSSLRAVPARAVRGALRRLQPTGASLAGPQIAARRGSRRRENARMARQRREPSFQEVVDALKATPTASTAIPEAPGIYADGTVITPDGRRTSRSRATSPRRSPSTRRRRARRWSGTRAAAVATALSPGSTRPTWLGWSRRAGRRSDGRRRPTAASLSTAARMGAPCCSSRGTCAGAVFSADPDRPLLLAKSLSTSLPSWTSDKSDS